jgi:DNA-binding NarL/FixJ family response regulator
VKEPLHVLIADDHPLFRTGLRLALDHTDGIEVVGEAATGVEAVQMSATLQPDIVVMDLDLPELHGVEAIRRVVAESPHVRVLVLTMFDDDDSVFAAMRAGARGYLLKGAGQTDIARAVRGIAADEAIFGPSVAQRIIDFFAKPRPPGAPPAFPQLSPREREVLDLVAAGRSNHAIAARLVLSHKTVRNHLSNIFSKLQVAHRSEAIVLAREAGLGVPHDPA